MDDHSAVECIVTANKMSTVDESLRKLAGAVAYRIVESYAHHRITLEECLSQIRDEQRREIASVAPFPRYPDWLEIAVVDCAEKKLAPDSDELEKLKNAMSRVQVR